jgi:hypothetical protein
MIPIHTVFGKIATGLGSVCEVFRKKYDNTLSW